MPFKNPTHGQLVKKLLGRGSRAVDLRPSACARGYGRKWQKRKTIYLFKNPLCKLCGDAGLVAAAKCVDHIIPSTPDRPGFWDPDNWQGLCTQCHSKKTATEDGGFGNQKKEAV